MNRIRHRANDPMQYATFFNEQRFAGIEVDVRYSQLEEKLYLAHDALMLSKNSIGEHCPLIEALRILTELKQSQDINWYTQWVVVLDIKENGLHQFLAPVLKYFHMLQFYIMGFAGMEYPAYHEAFKDIGNVHLMYRVSEHEPPVVHSLPVMRREPYLIDSFNCNPMQLLTCSANADWLEEIKMSARNCNPISQFFIGPDCHGKQKYEGSQQGLDGGRPNSSYLITKEPS